MDLVNDENEVVVRSKDELQSELFAAASPVLSRNRRNAEVILDAVSAHLQSAMNMAQAESLSDAYQTVDDVVLQMGSDGNYTATLRDEKGRIVEHVPLKRASSKLATAIKEGFAVNCAIAGQAQMMQVSKQLEDIQSALAEQKELNWREKINAVECAMLSFQDAVAVSDDQTAQVTLVMMSRDRLRTALADVYSAMETQVRQIPKATDAAGFFDNWGTGKTKSEKAEEYFRYFIQLVPAFCRGMSLLAMTDAFVPGEVERSGIVFAKRFGELLKQNDVQSRMALVPTFCGKDPERMIADIAHGIDVSIQKLQSYERELESGKLKLTIPFKGRS